MFIILIILIDVQLEFLNKIFAVHLTCASSS